MSLSLHLEIELLSDAALTARSATVGGHDSLPYVPGSVLLGAAANVLYSEYTKKSPTAAWDVFHSGRVRFGNGLPLDAEGQIALPMPLSLYIPKGVRSESDSGELSFEVVNLTHAERQPGVQLAQLRSGFINRFGTVVRPLRRSSLRTSVDPSGSAREGLLFGLGAIRQGLRFHARVDADHESLLEELRATFHDREIFIGRSRHAELGRARVRVVPPVASHSVQDGGSVNELVVWCLSDLWLRDPSTLQPTLEPKPSWFGLPDDWQLLGDRSFLRTRRYSPFNGKRQRPDSERQVITAGAVLHFKGRTPRALDAIRQATAVGIGDGRAEGLGQVLIEPVCLSDRKPSFESRSLVRDVPPQTPATPQMPATPPSGELYGWLSEQVQRNCSLDRAWELAKAWTGKIQQARQWRLPASQWREVGRIAHQYSKSSQPERLPDGLRSYLFDGVRALEKRWGAKDRKLGALNEWLVSQVQAKTEQQPAEGDSTARMVALAVELLSNHVVRAQKAEARR